MIPNSIGDLSHSFQLRRQNAALKMSLERYSQELSSGVSSDLPQKLRGNFNALAGLERGISMADSYLVGISERRLESSATQKVLEKLSSLGEVSGSLLTVQETGDPTLVVNAGRDAAERFQASLQTLNSQVGGRFLFSGNGTDLPSVAGAEAIFTAIEVEIAVAGANSATDIAAVVENWFDVGGGYDLIGYTGGAQPNYGVRLSDSEVLQVRPTAQDESIRSFLTGLAMGGIVGRGVLATNSAEQGRLARIAGEALILGDAQLVDLMAKVGLQEQQVDRAETEVRSELQSLEMALNELVSADPFETAVRFENAEMQLQALYSVTARLSNLSLANYL